jgi:hypothetical protein
VTVSFSIESAEQRLAALGIALPDVPTPIANFVPFRRHEGLVYLAGQVCEWNGDVLFVGKVGERYELAEAQQAARVCGLNLLAALRTAEKPFRYRFPSRRVASGMLRPIHLWQSFQRQGDRSRTRSSSTCFCQRRFRRATPALRPHDFKAHIIIGDDGTELLADGGECHKSGHRSLHGKDSVDLDCRAAGKIRHADGGAGVMTLSAEQSRE